MVLSRLTKITGPGVATDTNWVGNNADFTGITTTATSFNIGVTTIHSTLIESHNIVSTGVITATGGSFSGNVTAVDGTFSGNVSIAGTLTYEDVTNIDSVGIITAPALDVDDFLDVGSSIKLGNAGVITATSFVGSGAALTGIDATAIKDSGGNVKVQAQASGAMYTGIHTFSSGAEVGSNIKLGNAGVVTATSFTGSGANLTSLPAGQLTGTVADARISTLTASKLSGALPAISGANLTNLDASDLASGTVPTARLGSGTASSSTFLRGDSTFAAVTSTTINSNTNNYLITGTGTADTLQGEANMTFDGSLLKIASRAVIGNGSEYQIPSRSNTSSYTPQFQITGAWNNPTHGATMALNGRSDYPLIWLNSGASFADNSGCGVITWSIKDGAGNYCNTAEIRSHVDGTPANNDSPGDLSFRTTPAGACQPTEALRITSTGNIQIGGNYGTNNLGKLSVDGALGVDDGGSGTSTLNIMTAANSRLKLQATGSLSQILTQNNVYFAIKTDAGTGSGTERLRIKSDGSTFLQTSNVNINRGTSGAGYPLTVRGPSSGDVVRLERANSGQWHFGFDGNTNFYVKSNTTEVARITTGGKIGINISNPGDYNDDADALVVCAPSGNHSGITIRSNYAGSGSIYFADGTSTTDAYKGYIVYSQPNDIMYLGVQNATKLQINANGAFGLAGSNYGSSGQVLTSQGSGSGVQWATIASPKLLQVKYIERTAARATAHNGSSWAEALETQFRVSITPSATGNTIICHLFLAYTAGNVTLGSMIPVYHDGSTAYSMVGGAGSSAYQAPSGVLSGAGNMNEDLRNNSGNTQWFNVNKIGRYVTTNTNAATIRVYSRNSHASFQVGDNSQACSMLVMEYQGDIDLTT